MPYLALINPIELISCSMKLVSFMSWHKSRKKVASKQFRNCLKFSQLQITSFLIITTLWNIPRARWQIPLFGLLFLGLFFWNCSSIVVSTRMITLLGIELTLLSSSRFLNLDPCRNTYSSKLSFVTLFLLFQYVVTAGSRSSTRKPYKIVSERIMCDLVIIQISIERTVELFANGMMQWPEQTRCYFGIMPVFMFKRA